MAPEPLSVRPSDAGSRQKAKQAQGIHFPPIFRKFGTLQKHPEDIWPASTLKNASRPLLRVSAVLSGATELVSELLTQLERLSRNKGFVSNATDLTGTGGDSFSFPTRLIRAERQAPRFPRLPRLRPRRIGLSKPPASAPPRVTAAVTYPCIYVTGGVLTLGKEGR